MTPKERSKLRDEALPLLSALKRAIDAHTTLGAAKAAFEGTSFDYFHHEDIEAEENAAIELAYQIKQIARAPQ